MEPLARVIKHFGNARKVAAALNLSRDSTAVYQWKQIPVARVRELERLTGIPAAELRPDVFGESA